MICTLRAVMPWRTNIPSAGRCGVAVIARAIAITPTGNGAHVPLLETICRRGHVGAPQAVKPFIAISRWLNEPRKRAVLAGRARLAFGGGRQATHVAKCANWASKFSGISCPLWTVVPRWAVERHSGRVRAERAGRAGSASRLLGLVVERPSSARAWQRCTSRAEVARRAHSLCRGTGTCCAVETCVTHQRWRVCAVARTVKATQAGQTVVHHSIAIHRAVCRGRTGCW